MREYVPRPICYAGIEWRADDCNIKFLLGLFRIRWMKTIDKGKVCESRYSGILSDKFIVLVPLDGERIVLS